jgi:hypothetical protein
MFSGIGKVAVLTFEHFPARSGLYAVLRGAKVGQVGRE